MTFILLVKALISHARVINLRYEYSQGYVRRILRARDMFLDPVSDLVVLILLMLFSHTGTYISLLLTAAALVY